ncbi:MAG: hypothetical protein WAL59_19260 [Roseiarcus sp.]
MGREAPRERRTHLFAVIEEMTRERPQGEPDMNPARIAHLIEIARLREPTTIAGWSRSSPSETTRIWAI